MTISQIRQIRKSRENQTEFLSRASKYEIFSTGDINYDFIINILDVINMIGIIIDNSEYNYMADINNDNIVDILDIIEIINIIIDN